MFVSVQAQQILSACQEKIDVSNTEGYELFITQLKEGLKNTSHETAANHKVAKVSLILKNLLFSNCMSLSFCTGITVRKLFLKYTERCAGNVILSLILLQNSKSMREFMTAFIKCEA